MDSVDGYHIASSLNAMYASNRYDFSRSKSTGY